MGKIFGECNLFMYTILLSYDILFVQSLNVDAPEGKTVAGLFLAFPNLNTNLFVYTVICVQVWWSACHLYWYLF